MTLWIISLNFKGPSREPKEHKLRLVIEIKCSNSSLISKRNYISNIHEPHNESLNVIRLRLKLIFFIFQVIVWNSTMCSLEHKGKSKIYKQYIIYGNTFKDFTVQCYTYLTFKYLVYSPNWPKSINKNFDWDLQLVMKYQKTPDYTGTGKLFIGSWLVCPNFPLRTWVRSAIMVFKRQTPGEPTSRPRAQPQPPTSPGPCSWPKTHTHTHRNTQPLTRIAIHVAH